MLSPLAAIRDPKAILRERMKGERRAAAKARPDARIHAASVFMSAPFMRTDGRQTTLPTPLTVSLYYPMRNELDTEPLAAALIEAGAQLALPVPVRKKAPLLFRRYTPGDPLESGRYGEMVPTDTAEETTPNILVVPLLAFTRAGGRLGYGGGYYDRTLEALRQTGAPPPAPPLAIGYAFGAQEVDAIPLSPLDQPMDWIVTERGATKC